MEALAISKEEKDDNTNVDKVVIPNNDDQEDYIQSTTSEDSADEALCEMLGIPSLGLVGSEEQSNDDDNDDIEKDSMNENNTTISHHDESTTDEKSSSSSCGNELRSSIPQTSSETIEKVIQYHSLSDVYATESICVLPKTLSIPSQLMRRLTDELVWGSHKFTCDRTHETIRYYRKPKKVEETTTSTTTTSTPPTLSPSDIKERRELTRLENFVNCHPLWKELCHGHLARCISSIIGEPMVLFKEKLNLKPPGGSGFAPHLDTPSLRVALSSTPSGGGKNNGNHHQIRCGPKTFVTVMVAIDDMTEKNGCLKVCKGNWSEDNHCEIIEPEIDGNPDAGGRSGAIPLDIAERQCYEPITCRGGDIIAFNGWAPHRSTANNSPFHRRAVFLTYNPMREGDFHDLYYDQMRKIRNEWKSNMQMERMEDQKGELAALSTIPRI